MKKKKTLLAVLGSIVIVVLVFLGIQIYQKAEEQKIVKKNREKIPALVLENITEGTFFTKNIDKERNTLFIVFNPDCHFCQLEATEMQEKAMDFKDFNVYFVSTAPKEEIQKFAKIYGFNNSNNITFLYDHTDSFATAVGAHTVPFMMLYDAQHQLIKAYKGSVKLDLILEDAEKNRKNGS